MGTKCYLFFDCTGRSAKEGGKERKKEKLDALIKDSLFWHKFRQRILGVQFRFWCWTRLSMLKRVFNFFDIATRVQYQKKFIVSPQFWFCFCCYHHQIFWKFVTLFRMGKRVTFFLTVRGVKKERKKGLCWSVIRGVPGALRGFYFISMVEVETRNSGFLEVKRPDAITTII